MFSERFIYQPNKNGNFDFSGPAILHKDIVKDYSQEEINNLIKEINLRLQFRKSDKGNKHIFQYGYCENEIFYDLKFCKTLELRAVTRERIKKIDFNEFQSPELLEEDNAFTISESYYYKRGLGKIAFRNYVEKHLKYFSLRDSYKERIEKAVDNMKWLKENHPRKFSSLVTLLNKE